MPAHHFFHIGTFLVLVASILLLISTISAPVINSISFLKVHTPAGRQTFGALGYCSTSNTCSKSHIGYDIAAIISSSSGTTYKNGALENLTKALVLHPVATGVAFIAFLIAAGSHCVGFLFASIIAAIAWVITLVLVVIDFSLFGAAKVHINNDITNASASYGVAVWLTLAAFIVLFFATITTCFACFTDRRSRTSRGSKTSRY